MSHIDSTRMDGATGAERLCVISWTCPHPPPTPPPVSWLRCALCCLSQPWRTVRSRDHTRLAPLPLCVRLSEVKSEGSDPSLLRLCNAPWACAQLIWAQRRVGSNLYASAWANVWRSGFAWRKLTLYCPVTNNEAVGGENWLATFMGNNLKKISEQSYCFFFPFNVVSTLRLHDWLRSK